MKAPSIWSVLLIENNRQFGEAVREQLNNDRHAVDWMNSLADAGRCEKTVDYELIRQAQRADLL